MNKPYRYPHTASAAAFPLGGIGTGTVSLGARGELRDWEIFNRPAKGSSLPNTFFALRVQAGEETAVTKVLEGPFQPPYPGSHGYHPVTSAGLPRLEGATLCGEYPLAHIEFVDSHLPVKVELDAFNPLIPLNAAESGIPCAIFTYSVTNLADETVALTLAGSLMNPVGGVSCDEFGNPAPIAPEQGIQSRNDFRQAEGMRGLFFHSEQLAADDLRCGNVTLVTLHPEVSSKRAWLRAGWYDYLREFWEDLEEDGRLTDLGYENPSRRGLPDTGSVAAADTLEPEEIGRYTFILSWYFPNRPNSWSIAPDVPVTRNQYATRFADSWAVARYVAQHLPRLRKGSERFHEALFGSSLPPEVIEALSVSIVPIRSNTCFWLEDGRFYGYEGCFDDSGCCPGSCTHVWSYAYTLAYLFPSLEREMRLIEFDLETDESGYMHFRALKPFDELFVSQNEKPPAAADGQMGSILRVYREWLLSGDHKWLARVWPGVKRAISFAGREWDKDGDGVLDGRQHNTYDIEFYGPNPLCSTYYLAALRAVEELAGVMGETAVAEQCREVFDRGSRGMDGMLWNGEYYEQRLNDVNAYRYQHGTGCLTDQMLGQLHAELLGLGNVLPADHVRQAVDSVFRYNFKQELKEHVNLQRTFALEDEGGLLLCSWPRGGKPEFPFPYSDEVWTGCEYHVAAHLMKSGRMAEGLQIVRAARNRYDGLRRNPWDEVECGHHYARSMSAWMLLLALSGMTCDAEAETLRFDPVLAGASEAEFRCFWSNGRAWGIYRQERDGVGWRPSVEVLGGELEGTRIMACGREWTAGE